MVGDVEGPRVSPHAHFAVCEVDRHDDRFDLGTDLLAALATRGLDGVVRDAFAGGPLLTAAGLGAARFLPRPRRQRGYGLLMSLASTYGITVSVCGLTNPDFGAPRPPVAPAKRRDRLPLFPAESLA